MRLNFGGGGNLVEYGFGLPTILLFLHWFMSDSSALQNVCRSSHLFSLSTASDSVTSSNVRPLSTPDSVVVQKTMSGIEIVGTIAAIVSAITAVRESIQKARRERRSALQSATQKLELGLIDTLNNGPPRINREYDTDLARIGPAFSRGDGTKLP